MKPNFIWLDKLSPQISQKAGKWVETETDINRDQLPVVVVRKLDTYQGYDYGEIARTATPGKTIYEVELHKGKYIQNPDF